MGLKDLVEHRLEPVQIVEEATGEGTLVFEAVVSEADHINRNRRMYPLDVLWPAFSRVNEDTSAYPGTVDHPEPFGPVSVNDLGIKWESFWLGGPMNKTIYGRGRIIPTEKGRNLRAAMEAGIKIGFSTRTKAFTEERVIDDKLVDVITAMEPPFVDAVVDPSVGHARVQSVTKEETERMDEKMIALAEAKGRAEAELALREAQEAKGLAEARAQEFEAALNEARNELAGLRGRVSELTEKLAAQEASEADAVLSSRLAQLTEGHRFAAAIIERAKRMGATPETAESLVAEIKDLIEDVATAANEQRGEPRGQVTPEAEEPSEGAAFDDETMKALREARLI